jgi:hypothetical protein
LLVVDNQRKFFINFVEPIPDLAIGSLNMGKYGVSTFGGVLMSGSLDEDWTSWHRFRANSEME